MILIFTIDTDPSTNYVINWLDYYNAPWLRINSKKQLTLEKTIFKVSKSQNYFQFQVSGKKLSLTNLKSIWYRRTPEYIYPNFNLNDKHNSSLKTAIEKNLLNETNSIYSFCTSLMKEKYSLGNPSLHNLNKVDQLKIAGESGLKIPETIVTNEKNEVLKFYDKHQKIIIKPLQNITFHQVKGKYYIPYTKLLHKREIAKLPILFNTCLLQKYIEKEFEVRSFYLSGRFYSMAIFSQGNKQTKVDFRVYDEKVPNRVVPYKLPKNIETKLEIFIKKYKLNTGSFDLVFSTERKFVFLELNPVGQFGMVSYPCNYFLEKKIALNLINHKNEKKGKRIIKGNREK